LRLFVTFGLAFGSHAYSSQRKSNVCWKMFFYLFLFAHLNKKRKTRIHLIFQCEDYVAKVMAMEAAVEIYRKQVVCRLARKIDD
jgi:hypothetical protein